MADESQPRTRSRRRRRRKRDDVQLVLCSSVRSQCNEQAHFSQDFCPTENCHFLNLECVARVLRSARKSISLAMYQFSERSLLEAILHAKEKNNVFERIVVDNKMRQNGGAVFQDMVAHDLNVKWQKQAPNMASLMHHKYCLIDAEPMASDESSSSEDENESDDLCPSCKSAVAAGDHCSDENKASVESKASGEGSTLLCVQCRPVRIHSIKDLVQFPSDSLPRLPKHGLLITGSHNWSVQAFRENYENVVITSNPRLITQMLKEFNSMWTYKLKQTYVPPGK